jgi:integrase/recombinase XerD
MQRVNGYDQAFLLKQWLKERAALPYAAETNVLFLSQKQNAAGERILDRSRIYRLFVQICEEAKISTEYQHPHVIRHSAGQILYDNGASLEEIQQVLGHKSLNTVTVYARPRQDEVSKKVSQIYKKIF